MRHQNEPGLVGDPLLERSRKLGNILWGDRDLHRLQDDSLAEGTLAQRGQHARIILCRGQDLVAGPKIEAVEEDLKRLRCVAGDGDSLGSTADSLAQACARPTVLALDA